MREAGLTHRKPERQDFMKRLNIKLVVALVVVSVMVVVGGYFAHAFQYGSAAESNRSKADELLKDNKRAEALKQYVLYIRQKEAASDPKVLAQAALLAKSIAFEQPSRDTVTQAFDLLRTAIRQQPENADLRQAYAELMMYIQQYQEAIDPLVWLTDQKRGRHDPKFDLMLAQCYVHRSFYDKAVDICAGVIGFNSKTRTFNTDKASAPTVIDAYDLLARLLQEKVEPAQPATADLVMDQMVKANKDSWQAHLRRARYLQQYARGEKLRDALAKEKTDLDVALKLAPNEPDVILVAAQAALTDNRFADSQALLERGIKLYPKNVSMYRQWAVLKSTEGKLGEAEAEVVKGMKVLPDNPDMLWILCGIKMQQRDIAGVRQTLEALKKTKYSKTLVDLMAARLLFFQGKWREAAQEFERLRPLLAQSPEHTKQIDLYLAQCYGQLGEYDKQLDASNRVVIVDPTSFPARIGVAMAHLQMGKTEQARQEFRLIASQLGKDRSLTTPQVWRPLVQLTVDDQMRLPKEKRDWSGVDAIIGLFDDDFVAKQPSDADRAAIALMKAEVELHKGNLPKAKTILLDARKKYPGDTGIWSALATVTYQTDNPSAGLKVLDSAPTEIRDDVTLRLNRAGLLLRQGGKNAKQAILALDAGSDQLPAADRARLWSGLGAALLSMGEQDAAIKFWSKAADASPDDLKIRFSLFDLARETGDEATMSKMVEQFRSLMGLTSAEARYADAARTVALVRKAVRQRTPTGQATAELTDHEKEQLAGARKLLDEVGQERSNWYELFRAMGDIEVVEGPGHETDAITDYEKALELGPSNPLIIRPLVLLLSHQNRTEEVKKYLDMIGSDYVTELGLERIQIGVDETTHNYDEAIARAKREVPDNSTDPSAHLWIANVYEHAGRYADAEASFRRAVATGPDQPETWLRLLEHLAAHQKASKIGDVLIDARKQLPEDRVNQVLGPGYELIGQIPQAEQYYKAALEASPDDPATHQIVADFYARVGRTDDARKEALAVLRLSGDDPKNEAHVVWARRTLADLFMSRGSYQDFLKAKGLLEENAEKTGQLDDKLLVAKLLGERPQEPQQWREAAKILESLGPSTALPPGVQVKLAQLHEVLGDWTTARREMGNFLASPNAGPTAYAVFVDMLIRHNEIADAASWLNQLDAKAPWRPGDGLTSAAVLRSRVLVAQHRIDEAVALLKSVVPSRPLPPEKLPLLRAVGLQLAQLGLNPAAEEILREYVSYEPQGKLVLASFLGKNGRFDEALDLCEQSLKIFPKAVVLEITSEMFEAQPSHIEPKHIERVAKLYDSSLRDDPDSAPLLLQYARFLDISGSVDQAEKIYRDLLHRNDLDATQRSIALNNLAFSLAIRKKDLSEALSYINEAAELFGNNSDVLDTRGMVYVAMGNYPKALADLSDAVLVTEPSGLKLLHLALAQDLSGDRSAAKQSFRRAKEQKLDPTALRGNERDSYDRLSKDLGP